MAATAFRKDSLFENPFSFWGKVSSLISYRLGIGHKPSACKKVFENGAGRAQGIVANSAKSNGKASGVFVCSDASRIVMEKVREARRSGKPLKFRGVHSHLLKRSLDNTPIELRRDREWEDMRDVGKEIVD